MANWLQKITLFLAASPKGAKVPMLRAEQRPGPLAPSSAATPSLPNASIIYGVAASALFVFGLYFLLTGRWFTGALICIVGGCFLGFALYFLKR